MGVVHFKVTASGTLWVTADTYTEERIAELLKKMIETKPAEETHWSCGSMAEELGYAAGVTDNYFRHGTTTIFAALDVATGIVQATCKSKHRHQEFIQFLNQINRNVPKDLAVHVILDNYATHKHAKAVSLRY